MKSLLKTTALTALTVLSFNAPTYATDTAAPGTPITVETLVDQAEQDIVETARNAQAELEEIISIDAFAIATKSSGRKSASAPTIADTEASASAPPKQIAGE